MNRTRVSKEELRTSRRKGGREGRTEGASNNNRSFAKTAARRRDKVCNGSSCSAPSDSPLQKVNEARMRNGLQELTRACPEDYFQ